MRRERLMSTSLSVDVGKMERRQPKMRAMMEQKTRESLSKRIVKSKDWGSATLLPTTKEKSDLE